MQATGAREPRAAANLSAVALEHDGFPLYRAELIEEIKQLRAAVSIYQEVARKGPQSRESGLN
jgi:hypothetical protein